MLFDNKKGSVFNLIYGLFFLAVLGILFIIFNQITVNNIRPILDTPSLNFSNDSKEYADNFIGVWNLWPYIIVFITSLFFIIWVGMRGAE